MPSSSTTKKFPPELAAKLATSEEPELPMTATLADEELELSAPPPVPPTVSEEAVQPKAEEGSESDSDDSEEQVWE